MDKISYSGNLSQGKSFANLAISGRFTKVLTAKIFFEYRGGSLSMGVSLFSTTMARQYLPNSSLPNRHVDMVASSSCSRQFNLIRDGHTHKLSFPTIHKSFNRENSTFSNLREFSPVKGSRYTVAAHARWQICWMATDILHVAACDQTIMLLMTMHALQD